jgi:hypothetical protein
VSLAAFEAGMLAWMALSHEVLFKRPIGSQYGLVCYIGADHRIDEVIRQSIELIGPPPGETRMRFYNPDANQPWINKIGG